jgi:hypothetical protein
VTEERDSVETWLYPATPIVPYLKVGCALGILEGLGEPLGSSANFPKPNLVGACMDSWHSLLESWIWRCGTCVHACSKCEAKVDVLLIFYIHISVAQIITIVSHTVRKGQCKIKQENNSNCI